MKEGLEGKEQEHVESTLSSDAKSYTPPQSAPGSPLCSGCSSSCPYVTVAVQQGGQTEGPSTPARFQLPAAIAG